MAILSRHSDPNLTTKIYTDAGMLPIWDAVGALPMFNDTQKLVENSQSAPTPVLVNGNERDSVGPEAEKFSPSMTTSVANSPESEENAPCRNRTCNPVIKSHLLCQLS
jgi:hypothetical protein